MHRRVQRLHPAVQALGEAGHLLDRGDRDAGVGDRPRGRAGGHELDAGRVQAAGQLLQAGLVVDAEQRAADRRAVGHRELFLVRSAVTSCATVSTSSSRSTTLMRSCSLASSSPGGTGDLALRDDRPGVDARVDQVHGAPVTLHAGGQRVAHGVRAGERRQQRRVGVDQPAAERLEDRRADELHEAGRDDQVRLVRGELGGQRAVPGGAVGMVGERRRRRSAGRGAAARSRPAASPVGADGDDLGRVAGSSAASSRAAQSVPVPESRTTTRARGVGSADFQDPPTPRP